MRAMRTTRKLDEYDFSTKPGPKKETPEEFLARGGQIEVLAPITPKGQPLVTDYFEKQRLPVKGDYVPGTFADNGNYQIKPKPTMDRRRGSPKSKRRTS